MHLPVTRLRGCARDVRTPRRTELLRPCRHGAPAARRIRRPGRDRTPLHAAILPAEPRCPRTHMEVRRRPSEPPHCTHVPPPGRMARVVGRLSGFCMVCCVTYGIVLAAMTTAWLTH